MTPADTRLRLAAALETIRCLQERIYEQAAVIDRLRAELAERGEEIAESKEFQRGARW